LFGGGRNSSSILNQIEYITTDTTGNSTDFGDLVSGQHILSAVNNATTAIFGGGTTSDSLQSVTIATTGNASDFGDLLASTYAMASMSGAAS
jgi:hypothetical protein